MQNDEIEYSFYGQIYSNGCPGCNRVEPQPSGLDCVYENTHCRVHQDYALPIPGMMVVETKRHVRLISDLTEGEQFDLNEATVKVRAAMLDLGIDIASLVIEDKSSHIHLWLMPIYEWMKKETNGKTRNFQDIFDYAKTSLTTEANIKEIERVAQELKVILNQ